MNERIRKLRKALGLSQEQLGAAIGVSNTAISKIEKGENNLTEQNIKAICREFNVNEKWLRDGIGKPYVESDDSAFAHFSKEHHLTDIEQAILRAYVGLPKEQRNMMQEVIHRISVACSNIDKPERISLYGGMVDAVEGADKYTSTLESDKKNPRQEKAGETN